MPIITALPPGLAPNTPCVDGGGPHGCKTRKRPLGRWDGRARRSSALQRIIIGKIAHRSDRTMGRPPSRSRPRATLSHLKHSPILLLWLTGRLRRWPGPSRCMAHHRRSGPAICHVGIASDLSHTSSRPIDESVHPPDRLSVSTDLDRCGQNQCGTGRKDPGIVSRSAELIWPTCFGCAKMRRARGVVLGSHLHVWRRTRRRC